MIFLSLLWKPSQDVIKNSNMTIFIEFVNKKYNLKIKTYNELLKFSIDKIEQFWQAMWDFGHIKSSQKFENVIEDITIFPGTKWFPGAKINFAENLLRYRDDKRALVFRGESRKEYSLTYKQLNDEVSKLAISLKKLDLQVGDRVVAYMPNIIETVIAMLATASIGCVWASCGAELGADAVIDRLEQVKPKVLFTVDGYIYKGKNFSILENVLKVTREISTLKKVIILPFIEDEPNVSEIDNSILFQNFQSENLEQPLVFEQLPFDQPLYIMFSSGTTGKPKSMVQSAGGVLINHLKELLLHTDLKREDTICYITSPSWMMWNWLVSSLSIGATILLFNGNPTYPDWKTIWKIIEKEKVTIFGTSASYIHYLMKESCSPKRDFDLTALREISQTASPLSEEGFNYIYKEIKEDIHFNSISGGTDINGCFACGSPIIPVYAGQIQSIALGMSVKAYDDEGNPVLDTQGELVCEKPSPSMPLYFWGDENNTKYKEAYFEHFQDLRNVWRHGDYIVIHSKTGGITFHGRSDAVLKPSGVRIGTSEIYNILETFSEIEDSVVIGQQWEGDQRIVLFVKLREGMALDDDLKTRIKTILKEKASPRHVPSIIEKTYAIPYTFSNKKVEVAITKIAHGKPVTNTGSLANPESLDFYRKYFKIT